MLDGVDEMTWYFRVTIGYWGAHSKVLEGFVFFHQLGELQFLSILELGVTILFVYLDGFSMISWYLESIHVDGAITVGL